MQTSSRLFPEVANLINLTSKKISVVHSTYLPTSPGTFLRAPLGSTNVSWIIASMTDGASVETFVTPEVLKARVMFDLAIVAILD